MSAVHSRETPTAISAKGQRALKAYEDHLHVRYAATTVPNYLKCVRDLLEWLAARRVEVTETRSEDLLAFQQSLLSCRTREGRPYSVGRLRAYITAMKGFFRLLCRRSWLLHDPSASVEYPRPDKHLPRAILSPREVRKVLEAAKGKGERVLRDRAILEMLYATGLRASELANLTPYDVDTEERTVRVTHGKGGKDRIVPLTHAAARVIEVYVRQSRPRLIGRGPGRHLFLTNRGGRFHKMALSLLVRHYVRKAGLKKRITAHSFRHSLATHLLRGRCDIRHIQVLLGHSSLSSTEQYTRVEVSDLRKVIERAHPRGR